MADPTATTEYLYPQAVNKMTDTMANYTSALPQFATDVYQNWYNQPLSTGTTPYQQQAWSYAMSDPSQQWAQGVNQAQSTALGAQPYYQQAAGALSPWGSTIGAGLSTLGQTVGAVNPYLSGMNTYQQLGQDAMSGYNTATNTLAGTMGQVNPYMSAMDTLQQQAQGYAGQIGGGQTGVQQGMSALGGVSPYLQQAASQYSGSADYDPTQLQQYLNPYTQNAAQATVSELNRNLSENVLPGVNSTFTGAGQFGSSRNAEFESRAIRDTQEAAAKALAQANYGAYNQAQQAYSDWANKGMQAGQGLAGLAGQQTNLGQAYGSLGTQQAGIAQQQAQAALQNAGLDQNQASLVANLMPQLASMQGQITQNQVSDYLRQAGLDQTQAQLVAQMYPQLAAGYSSLGQQYGALSGAYGTLGTQQGNLANILGGLAGTGSTIGQTGLTNMMTTAQAQQAQEQATLDKAYQDYLTRQQYPLTAAGALSTAAKNVGTIQNPNVNVPVAQPDTVSRVLAAIQAMQGGLTDSATQSLLNQLFGSDIFNTGTTTGV